MRLFDNVKGYKTPENAMKKLRDVLGDDLGEWRYTIIVTGAGRFLPVVHGNKDGTPYCSLAHQGICVAG